MNPAELSMLTDPEYVQRVVDFASVVLDSGVVLEPADGRFVGCCPFHSDKVPSFSVFQWEDSGKWACACWSCSPFRNGTASVGDLFDYLQAFYQLSFSRAVSLAATYIGRDDLPELLEPEPRCNGPLPNLNTIYSAARKKRSGLLAELLGDRGSRTPADWVYQEWHVADGSGAVVIPHWSAAGELTALKRRHPADGWKNRAVRGSVLTSLYGAWRDDGDLSVILCEGESDTWSVSYLLRNRSVDVLGLPSGAAARPRREWIDALIDREVTVLFDADRAGRGGAARWAAVLPGARIAELPAGLDATSAWSREVRRAIQNAKSVGKA